MEYYEQSLGPDGKPLRRRDFLIRMGVLSVGAAATAALAGCGSGNDDDVTFNGNNPSPHPSPSPSSSPISSTDIDALGALPQSQTLERSDPQMRAVIEAFLAFNAPPITTLTPQQARQQPTIADAVRVVLQNQGRSTAPEPVGAVSNRTIPGPGGAIPVRVYTPSGTGPFPVIVYFHGGGWVIGTIDVYDSSARALTNAAQAVVVSVEYRKGPENRFPAAHEDAYAATQYVSNNAAEFNADPNRVAVAGESAGANLATASCILARDRNGKIPIYQALVYPVANNDLSTPSYRRNANAVPLSRPNVQYFLENYLRSSSDSANPLISLVKADLRNLPPATVITDAIDPLRSEGILLSERLRAAGVTVRTQDYEGVTHEFFGTGAVVDKAKSAVAFAAAGLRGAFRS